MGIQTAPAPVVYVADVLSSAPTAATLVGVYTQVSGTPPAGVGYGDLFWWDGTTAETFLEFYYAPATIEVENQCFSKDDDRYWVVSDFAIQGILTSALTAATPSGFYVQVAGAPPAGVALGDLFYWNKSTSKVYPRCAYTNAPTAITVAGQAYAKAPAPTYWKSPVFVPQYGEVVMPLATSISLAGGVTTILTINIPSAGLWRLEYTIRASIAGNGTSGSGAMSRIHDSGGNEVAGTRMTVGFTYGSSIQATGTMSKIVQTTGPATYTLRAYGWVANLTSIMSDSGGETKMSYQQLA